jgi:DNA polymerase sigma
MKLALFLKHWNKQNFPNRQKRLNSFSIILMLIAFLQHRKILPNLQALATERKVTRFEV